MEIGNQIKKYRAELKLSQEELAERVYVSRQTISNWENEKNYPDIHSLLLLSSVFGISLDELIKGDVEIMKREIKQEDVKNFNSLSNIFAVLFIASAILPIPLVKFLGWAGAAIYAVLFGVTMYFAIRCEKIKKANDVSTYKEVVAFMDGKTLDEISKYREEGKRSYQNVLKLLAGAAIGVMGCLIVSLIISLFE